MDKAKQDFISNYVLDHLKHKFVASINQTILRNFNLDVKAAYQDRAGTYTYFENDNFGSQVEYPPFWSFDGKLNYNWKNLDIFVLVNNIFDKNYVDIGNVPQPGRWTKFGISYQLNFK